MIVQIVCVYLCYPCTDRSNISRLTVVTGVTLSSGGSTVGKTITMRVTLPGVTQYFVKLKTIRCIVSNC